MSGALPTDPPPSTVDFDLTNYSLLSESVNGSTLGRSLAATRFGFKLKYDRVTWSEYSAFAAFVIAQEGTSETWTVTIPEISTMHGTATGTILVNGVHSVGDNTINVDGFTGTLAAGDYVKFSSHAKVYMVGAERSGSGVLTIYPALYEALANNEAVTFDDVPFTVRLRKPMQKFKMPQYDTLSLEIDCIEAT